MPRRFALGRVAASFAALTLLAFGALGASAAAGGPSPLPDVLDSLGVAGGNHGPSVRDAVHDAIDSGDPVGPAACAAAHDRETLPTPAPRTPPGQEGKDPKDCDKSNGAGEAAEDGLEQENGAPDNQGQAACGAAHDRSKLPTPAQDAPGHQEPKDCDGGED